MKEKLKYNVIMGVLHAVAILPLPVLYVFSTCICFVMYRVLHYRKKTVERNLQLSFPEKTERERKDIERRFYGHLCDCIVETIKLLHISDEEIDRRVEVLNVDIVDELVAEGHSIVLYLGHYGNWEWVQAIARHYKSHIVGGQIYKPLRDKVMDRVMLRIRSRFGLVSIPQKKAFRALLGYKQQGKRFMIGFISDQRPNAQVQHWTKFLNQDAQYVTGGEEIGRRIGARYLYMDVEKVSRGHYRLTFKPVCPGEELMKEEYPYTLEFMRMLEDNIRRAPAYWLWSHKRWKLRKPVTATTSGKA